MPKPGARDRGGPPIEAEIAFLLSKVGRNQSLRFVELLEPLGLRPKHFAILNTIALGDGPSQQQLGEALGLDPSGLIAAIDELEGRGMLERQRDPADRRRHALHLTASGTAKLSEAREASRQRGEELVAPLSRVEAKQFRDLLRRIAGAEELDLRPGP
jgi:DNA-binding MarR family transcriptional regulator